MAETSPAQRLRQIADEIRCLPEAFKQWLPGEIAIRASELFDEAVGLGAFADTEFARLRALVARQKTSGEKYWQTGAWNETVYCLAPALMKEHGVVDCIAPACGPIADIIDAEAAKLEVAAGEGPWSRPDTPTRWGKVFGVSGDTMKRRFKDGSIRNKKLSDRNYQVHLDDLPKGP